MLVVLWVVCWRDWRTCDGRIEEQQAYTGCDYQGTIGEVKDNWIGMLYLTQCFRYSLTKMGFTAFSFTIVCMYSFQIVEFCYCFLIHVYNSGNLILNGKIFEFFRGLWWYEGHDYSPWVFKTFPSIFNSLHPNYPWIFHNEMRIYAPFWLFSVVLFY
jgi:hypothetical protein